MAKYIEMPIVLPGPPDQEDGDRDVTAFIVLEEIAYFHPAYFWGTMICLKSGQLLMTRLLVREVERLINKKHEPIR